MLMKNKTILFYFALLPALAFAQPGKVQTAWRAISDYKSTLSDGKPDAESLAKAKESIDVAAEHPDTREKAKTWVYRSEIYYYIFRTNLKAEQDKLGSVADKDERLEAAYGNVDTTAYMQALSSLKRAEKMDKDKDYSTEISMIGSMVYPEINNLAVGKHKVKKYSEASGFFEAAYELSKVAFGKKDSLIINNAIICAHKGKDFARIRNLDKKMIADKIASPYTYQSLFDANMALKDTVAALQTLKDGLVAFPQDTYLMNRETEFYLVSGKQEEALANLDKAILKDPGSAQLFLVRGNVYDNLANPKDGSGKDRDKPKNYEELMGKAEADYTKATQLNPQAFDIWYNLGAMYNNWGAYYQTKADNLVKALQEQKVNEAKAKELFNKAIPPLEKALNVKPDDKGAMFALRKLYLLTGQNDKADKMTERMKN
jgi:tetratricopeptide (TPR) repeat protein